MSDEALRTHVRNLLGWQDAHASFESAVEGIPPALRGSRPERLPHSPWQLLEHLRITQKDILDFCVSAEYQEMKWPDDYWPSAPSPARARCARS